MKYTEYFVTIYGNRIFNCKNPIISLAKDVCYLRQTVPIR